MTSINDGALALGAGFVITTGGASWKAANLRSDIFNNYSSRVALAQAGLDERASNALRSLADKVNETLGALERFNPTRALADPTELRTHIGHVAHLLAARANLRVYFRRMLRIGPVLTFLLAVLLVCVLVALTYFSGWKHDRSIGYGGLWTAVGSLACVSVVAVYYFVLLHRFSGIEILSATNDA